MTALAALVVCAGASAGCAGGGSSTQWHCLAGDPFCGQVSTGYELQVASQPGLTAPLPVGGSATFTFTERHCTGTSSQSPVPPGIHLGCDPPFVPATLAVTVQPIANEGPANGPCGVSAAVTGPGKVTFTRTAPGDQRFFANNVPGWCEATVSDPTRNQPGNNLPAATTVTM